MRINVYNEELTKDFEFVKKDVPETGMTYYGFRIFLKSAPELHYTPIDDDRTAITFWFGTKEATTDFLREALAAAQFVETIPEGATIIEIHHGGNDVQEKA